MKLTLKLKVGLFLKKKRKKSPNNASNGEKWRDNPIVKESKKEDFNKKYFDQQNVQKYVCKFCQ